MKREHERQRYSTMQPKKRVQQSSKGRKEAEAQRKEREGGEKKHRTRLYGRAMPRVPSNQAGDTHGITHPTALATRHTRTPNGEKKGKIKSSAQKNAPAYWHKHVRSACRHGALRIKTFACIAGCVLASLNTHTHIYIYTYIHLPRKTKDAQHITQIECITFTAIHTCA